MMVRSPPIGDISLEMEMDYWLDILDRTVYENPFKKRTLEQWL